MDSASADFLMSGFFLLAGFALGFAFCSALDLVDRRKRRARDLQTALARKEHRQQMEATWKR